AKQLLAKLGYEIVNVRFRREHPAYPSDYSAEDIARYHAVKKQTMVPVECVYTLIGAVEYVIKHNIPGDFVECGVWRAGCCMAIAQTLQRLGVSDRNIY